MPASRSGFTLIELLIVIGIVAVLSVVVILVLNPQELLKQSRDSNRLADIASMSRALSIFATEQSSVSLGTVSTTYISLPDSSATCANLGLPPQPAGWTYHCVPSSTLRSTDGAGWIPVNLASLSYSSPISNLPVDPANATSSSLFYSYSATASGFHLRAVLESVKYAGKGASDGGYDAAAYETGSNLAALPFAHDLVGHWRFDGTYADASGYGNNGSQSGGAGFAAGQIGQAITLDGSAYVNAGHGASLSPSQAITVAAWFKTGTTIDRGLIAKSGVGATTNGDYALRIRGDGKIGFIVNHVAVVLESARLVNNGQWHQVVATYDRQDAKLYIDGTLDASMAATPAINDTGVDLIIGGYYSTSYLHLGEIDDVRIYNRALSAVEVGGLYAAAH